MVGGEFDDADWPTVPGWMWLEECGGPDGATVPFLELSYSRGAESVELALPSSPSLLLLWWELISGPFQPGDDPGWAPAWVWTERGGSRYFAFASLDPRDDVTPRQLIMPTSARARSTVRKAVTKALLLLTGEQLVDAALVSLMAARDDQPSDIEPETVEPTIDDDEMPTEPTNSDGSETADESWPHLPVWIWLETDDHGIWQAKASLSPTEDVPACSVQAPVSPVALTRLWLPVAKTLRGLRTGDLRTRTVPVWLWTSEEADGLVACFSFERVAGIGSQTLEIPYDEQTLTNLQECLGSALIWLTGKDSPGEAARELLKPPTSTLPPRQKPPKPATRQSKKPKKRRAAKRPADRRMVIPRIRIVSGGAPGLGKRR